jgi:hypothetical protein
MSRRPRNADALEARLLSACRQTIVEGRWQVAEHLPCALEDLSRQDCAADAAVEQAYRFLAERSFDEPWRH